MTSDEAISRAETWLETADDRDESDEWRRTCGVIGGGFATLAIALQAQEARSTLHDDWLVRLPSGRVDGVLTD
jgi:hypothetical protein